LVDPIGPWEPGPAQPFGAGYYPGDLSAPAPGTVYLDALGPKGEVIERTTDAGRAWVPVTPPCGPSQPGRFQGPDGELTAFSTDNLFDTCAVKPLTMKPAITYFSSFSMDAGRTWQHGQSTTKEPAVPGWLAVSSTTGWSTNGSEVMRTTDGGRSWRAVFVAPGSATLEALDATSPTRAYATLAVPSAKDTRFFVEGTSDAGRSWQELAAFSLPG
jgi:hypothetical protein